MTDEEREQVLSTASCQLLQIGRRLHAIADKGLTKWLDEKDLRDKAEQCFKIAEALEGGA